MLMFCGHRPMHPLMAHRQPWDRDGVFAPANSRAAPAPHARPSPPPPDPVPFVGMAMIRWGAIEAAMLAPAANLDANGQTGKRGGHQVVFPYVVL